MHRLPSAQPRSTGEDGLAEPVAPPSLVPDRSGVGQPPFWAGPLSAARRGADPIASTLQHEVIPRLARAYRAGSGGGLAPGAAPTAAEVQGFVARLLDGDDAAAWSVVAGMRRRGLPVEAVYLELLAPAARCLGTLWDDDLCDFPAVTVGLGRLQRMQRELSADFVCDRAPPQAPRRVLLTQPAQEQHSFGLSMVAEFFRRDGWIIDGGLGNAAVDVVARVQSEFIDVVGFSIGSQQRLAWLRERIAAVRAASRNPRLVVLVGGPLFGEHPQWAAEVGADGSAADACDAPRLAARLMAGSRAAPPAV